jgi:hypothetical protein
MNWGHDILVILGGQAGTWNLLWGGFLSCISEFAILGSLAAAYRKINCHEKGCLRIGHHTVDGTPYKVCRKHHPDLPDKARKGDIRRAYEAVKQRGDQGAS